MREEEGKRPGRTCFSDRKNRNQDPKVGKLSREDRSLRRHSLQKRFGLDRRKKGKKRATEKTRFPSLEERVKEKIPREDTDAFSLKESPRYRRELQSQATVELCLIKTKGGHHRADSSFLLTAFRSKRKKRRVSSLNT